MPEFSVPVRKEVPAYGEVVVEADTLEQACTKVKQDIQDNGGYSQAAEADFEADWEEAYDLRIASIKLPDGSDSSAE